MNEMLSTNTINNAVLLLNNKDIIAYPTESVFGIGCDPDSEVAVLRLLTLKQRPIEKGFILVAASYRQLKPYIDDSRLTQIQRSKIFSKWPGPVTFVFPILPRTPPWLTGQFNSLPVRVSNHKTIIELCKTFGKPIISTSANTTGMPPCRTINEIRKQFGNDFPIVTGKTGKRQKPSEIRDALTGKCLRQG